MNTQLAVSDVKPVRLGDPQAIYGQIYGIDNNPFTSRANTIVSGVVTHNSTQGEFVVSDTIYVRDNTNINRVKIGKLEL